MSRSEIVTYFTLVLGCSTAFAFYQGFPEFGTGREIGVAWYTSIANVIVFAPMVGAIVCAALFRRRSGLTLLWQRLKKIQSPWQVYLFAFFSMIPVYFVYGVIVAAWFGTPILTMTLTDAFVVFAEGFAILFVLIIGEEVGWRGYVLPGLQARMSPFAASLVIGVLWGAWHFPVFWGLNTATTGEAMYGWIGFSQMLLMPLLYSVIFTWAFNASGGSIIIAMIIHASNNAAARVFTDQSIFEHARGIDFWVISHASVIPLAVMAAFLVIRYRGMYFSRLSSDG